MVNAKQDKYRQVMGEVSMRGPRAKGDTCHIPRSRTRGPFGSTRPGGRPVSISYPEVRQGSQYSLSLPTAPHSCTLLVWLTMSARLPSLFWLPSMFCRSPLHHFLLCAQTRSAGSLHLYLLIPKDLLPRVLIAHGSAYYHLPLAQVTSQA